MDLSIILPCLNEELCIQEVIRRTKLACEGIIHEIIVIDNGSTDDSAKLAKQAGAIIVFEPKRGYGNALKKGILAAKGDYICMFDADLTYPSEGIPHFFKYIQQNYDLVIGNRFVSDTMKINMPFLHYYLGNPVLSTLTRVLYGSKVKDVHCGMRMFTKKAVTNMQLKSSGMEFASEMVIKAAKQHLKIKQIGIPYRERVGISKLNTWRDGWRHLRFMLLFSPTIIFFVPGIFLTLVGFLLMLRLSFGSIVIGSVSMSSHPLLFGSLMIISGSQLLMSGYFLRVMAVNYFKEKDSLIVKLQKTITLEKGLVLGFFIILTSVVLGFFIISTWLRSNYGALNINLGIVAATLAIIGVQIIGNSFYFVSIQAMSE